MAYKEIKRFKYMRKDPKVEFTSRFHSPSAMKTGFYISPINNGVKLKRITNELWANNIPEITSLINNIQKVSRQLLAFELDLTENRYHEFLDFLLIEEMQATNEYEGVKSTRQELKEALDSLNDKKARHRFKGLSLLYKKIGSAHSSRITSPETVRAIYDELVADEVEDEATIEADALFRQDKVMIGDDFATVHVGEDPEKIEEQLQIMLDFLNLEDLNFPSLVRVLLSHYMFEYIHPFYDGNGRVGRYLLANYLGFELDVFSSLLMSSSAVANRKAYEKAFVITSDQENYAEGTFFVLNLLELLYEAQEKIAYLLNRSQLETKRAVNFIKEAQLSDFEEKVFWLYYDHAVYGSSVKSLTRKDIHSHFEEGAWSEHKQRKAENLLEGQGFIERVGERPAKFRLSPAFQNRLREKNTDSESQEVDF